MPRDSTTPPAFSRSDLAAGRSPWRRAALAFAVLAAAGACLLAALALLVGRRHGLAFDPDSYERTGRWLVSLAEERERCWGNQLAVQTCEKAVRGQLLVLAGRKVRWALVVDYVRPADSRPGEADVGFGAFGHPQSGETYCGHLRRGEVGLIAWPHVSVKARGVRVGAARGETLRSGRTVAVQATVVTAHYFPADLGTSAGGRPCCEHEFLFELTGANVAD